MNPVRLSKSFTLDELTTTQLAQHLEANRYEALNHLPALKAVATDLLQPIRDHFGPVRVTSGYRGKALNAAVGGSASSQHCKGEAADFNVDGYEDEAGQLKVMRWVVKESGIKFRQLLLERGCIHISLPHMAAGDGEVARYDVPTKTKVRLEL